MTCFLFGDCFVFLQWKIQLINGNHPSSRLIKRVRSLRTQVKGMKGEVRTFCVSLGVWNVWGFLFKKKRVIFCLEMGCYLKHLNQSNPSPLTCRIELYDPCNPLSPDSDAETSKVQDCQLPPPMQDSSLRSQRPSPDSDSRRWESSTANLPSERQEFVPKARPTESRDQSPGHIMPKSCAYSPENNLLDRSGYDFPSRHLEPRVHSPDRLIHSSSTQGIPESFRGPRTNEGERKPLLDYQREVALKAWFETHRHIPIQNPFLIW